MKIEALAATRTLEFALEFGVNHAIVEGDLEVVVKALAMEELVWLLMVCYLKTRFAFFLVSILNYSTLIQRGRITKLLKD